jgi:hypothetical protein
MTTAMTIRRTLTLTAGCLLVTVTAFAQGSETIERLAADAEVSLRTTVTDGAAPQTVLMLDGVQHVRLFGGWTAVSRPMALRRTGADWAFHLAQFTVRREETKGSVAMRLEAGLLASPVGLGALTARASANPTITPATPFGRGVTVEQGAPPVQLYSLTYPTGAVASFSGRRWDARGGILDSTPLRVRWPLEKLQPKVAPHLLAAGGVTPTTGLRIGGWFTQGDWARKPETTGSTAGDRSASSGGVEVEYAVAWTRLGAEWVGSRVDTANGSPTLSTWMIEGLQTLSPRWFAAGRLRQADAFTTPPRGYTAALTTSGLRAVTEASREIVVGYRVTPDVTFRAGYLVTRAYGTSAWMQRAESSLVWARRWR